MSEIIIDVDWLKEHYKVKTDAELRDCIGAEVSTIRGWKKRGVPSDVQIKVMQYALQNETKGTLIPIHHRPNINSAGGYGAINDDESAEIIMVSEQMLRAMFSLTTFDNLDIIHVTGDSMRPIVDDGDTIMVRRTNEAKNNQIAIVRVGNELFIKYFQRHPLNKWVKLSSEDKDNYPDMDFNGEEVNSVEVVGVLIGKFKAY